MKKAILIFLIIILITACTEQNDDNITADVVSVDNVETIFAVNTTKAVEGEILDYIEVNGDVVTKTSVDIFAETAGKLTRLDIRLGSYVQKDQVIAEVDPSRPGMKYVNSPVKSPISGTIISIMARVGTTINQAVPIAKISKMDEIQIKTALSERYISKIKMGLDALLRFEAYPDERFSARITEVSPVLDPLTRTIEVRLNLLRYDKRIKVGMFAEVKIITQKKKNIVKIPADCLVKRYGGYYVFVVKDEQVERRKVNPGIQIDNKLEITEGLNAAEEVVMQGQTLLEDKAKVRIVEQIQPLTVQDVIE